MSALRLSSRVRKLEAADRDEEARQIIYPSDVPVLGTGSGGAAGDWKTGTSIVRLTNISSTLGDGAAGHTGVMIKFKEIRYKAELEISTNDTLLSCRVRYAVLRDPGKDSIEATSQQPSPFQLMQSGSVATAPYWNQRIQRTKPKDMDWASFGAHGDHFSYYGYQLLKTGWINMKPRQTRKTFGFTLKSRSGYRAVFATTASTAPTEGNIWLIFWLDRLTSGYDATTPPTVISQSVDLRWER